jgi:hypothetical protein
MSRYSMLVACGAVCLVTTAAHAQTATQSVAFEVQAINVLSAAGSPSLTITTAVPGSQPTQATAAGSYAITTNDSSKKITIQISGNMPPGVTLGATLTAPGTGTSAGAVTLSTTAVDAVTGIYRVIGSALPISYTLDALVTAGVVAPGARTVTLTIVSVP